MNGRWVAAQRILPGDDVVSSWGNGSRGYAWTLCNRMSKSVFGSLLVTSDLHCRGHWSPFCILTRSYQAFSTGFKGEPIR